MRRIVLIDDKHVDVTRTFTLGFTTDVQLFKTKVSKPAFVTKILKSSVVFGTVIVTVKA